MSNFIPNLSFSNLTSPKPEYVQSEKENERKAINIKAEALSFSDQKVSKKISSLNSTEEIPFSFGVDVQEEEMNEEVSFFGGFSEDEKEVSIEDFEEQLRNVFSHLPINFLKKIIMGLFFSNEDDFLSKNDVKVIINILKGEYNDEFSTNNLSKYLKKYWKEVDQDSYEVCKFYNNMFEHFQNNINYLYTNINKNSFFLKSKKNISSYEYFTFFLKIAYGNGSLKSTMQNIQNTLGKHYQKKHLTLDEFQSLNMEYLNEYLVKLLQLKNYFELKEDSYIKLNDFINQMNLVYALEENAPLDEKIAKIKRILKQRYPECSFENFDEIIEKNYLFVKETAEIFSKTLNPFMRKLNMLGYEISQEDLYAELKNIYGINKNDPFFVLYEKIKQTLKNIYPDEILTNKNICKLNYKLHQEYIHLFFTHFVKQNINNKFIRNLYKNYLFHAKELLQIVNASSIIKKDLVSFASFNEFINTLKFIYNINTFSLTQIENKIKEALKDYYPDELSSLYTLNIRYTKEILAFYYNLKHVFEIKEKSEYAFEKFLLELAFVHSLSPQLSRDEHIEKIISNLSKRFDQKTLQNKFLIAEKNYEYTQQTNEKFEKFLQPFIKKIDSRKQLNTFHFINNILSIYKIEKDLSIYDLIEEVKKELTKKYPGKKITGEILNEYNYDYVIKKTREKELFNLYKKYQQEISKSMGVVPFPLKIIILKKAFDINENLPLEKSIDIILQKLQKTFVNQKIDLNNIGFLIPEYLEKKHPNLATIYNYFSNISTEIFSTFLTKIDKNISLQKLSDTFSGLLFEEFISKKPNLLSKSKLKEEDINKHFDNLLNGLINKLYLNANEIEDFFKSKSINGSINKLFSLYLILNFNANEQVYFDAQNFELKQKDLLEILNVDNSFINRMLALMKNLSDINLESRSLLNIPRNISKFQMIEKLDLSNNLLTEVPSSIFTLLNLKELYLTNNFITEISRDIQKLHKLQILVISDNCLIWVSKAILNLKYLRHIDLSNNELAAFPSKDRDLNSSKIETIDEDKPSSTMESLSTLHIDGNQLLEIDDNIDKMPNLRHLTASRNKIKTVSRKVSKLKNLSIIDLSNNELSRITRMPEATELILSFNRISSITKKSGITKMKKLVILDLANNPLTFIDTRISALALLDSLSLPYKMLIEPIKPLESKFSKLRVLNITDKDEAARLPAYMKRLEFLKIVS